MITGAAGFIGSHLSDRLALENDLILIDDFSVGVRQNLESVKRLSGIQIVEASVTDQDQMRDLMSGVEVVFHMAISCLRTSIADPFLSHDINAGGTLSVSVAAREHEVERFIYVSSSEVYGSAQTVPMDELHPCHPTTVYGASKLAGEHYAMALHRTHGLPVSVVRPFNTYGPREPYQGSRAEVIPRFLLRLEGDQSPVVYGDGSQTRDFTFIDDTVNGLIQAAQCDALVGDAVNIARGEEVSIIQIASLLAALMRKTDLGLVVEAGRPGDVHRHYADIRKAERLLDFAPQIDIESGLSRTLEWFRSRGITGSTTTLAAGSPNW